MMREERAHDGHCFTFWKASTCVVERLIKSIGAASACYFQAAKVLQGRSRIDHGRQSGRVGCDDNIFAEAPLEPQAGHAEAGVLIIEVEVTRIVRGLGYSPGHAALR